MRKTTIHKIVFTLIFSIIFVVGIAIAYMTPSYVDSAYDTLKEKHSEKATVTVVDINRVEKILPVVEHSMILISSGFQLLGISGIIATLLKKED